MKRTLIFVFAVCLFAMLFAFSAFASDVTATNEGDILDAISQANDGDTVNITLSESIEVNTQIKIEKAITVNIDFNSKQLNYVGATGNGDDKGLFYINNKGASLYLNGSNPVNNYQDYTHYDNSVLADVTGTSNLIVIIHGNIYIKNMYMLAPADAFCINSPCVAGNQTEMVVESSVLRNADGATVSAITIQGANNKYNHDLADRRLIINNSVIYGGFYGKSYNFNLTRGSEFTNVKFYDFKIVNDCWYDAAYVFKDRVMSSFEHALPATNCIFNSYDETAGIIEVETYTGKQNIKLMNCTFAGVSGTFGNDGGGDAAIYDVITYPTCSSDGYADYYRGSTPTKNKNIGKLSHDDEVTIVYVDGYSSYGADVKKCKICGHEEIVKGGYAPLFENLGYSISFTGTSMVLGTVINQEAYSTYMEATNNEKFDFGYVVGNENGEVKVENGQLVLSNASKVSCNDNMGSTMFELIIVGIDTDEMKELPIIAEFYMFDGEGVSFADKNYCARAFNDIKFEIDLAQGTYSKESFEEFTSTITVKGYDGGRLSGSAVVEIVSGNGAGGTSGIKVSRSSTGNFEFYIDFEEERQELLGNNKYLVVWMDFTAVEMRKACWGLRSGSTNYRTDDYGKSPFYYLADGETEWVELMHGGDGCFGSGDGISMMGKKGYFAFPIEYFTKGSAKLTEDTLITGIYFYGDVNNGYQNKEFYFDNIIFAEDYTKFE
ncbi:MAG: hypothetical protein J6B45_01470 [Clostridia bacterium]|nr:hypothetical protein [Clostridia bacterium]